MSKCREAFEQHCKERGINPDGDYATDLYFDWQAAWNAAMARSSEICKERGNHAAAESIEQEQCE